MDKRIFELASQAGFSSWVLSPSKETMSDTPELLSKFAELIVQECAKVCNEGKIEFPMGVYYSKKIKERFGVE